MSIKGILFDLYGTLIDIETDEAMEEIYRGVAHFLTYQGVHLHRSELKDLYYRILKEQKEQSPEKYPEINVEAIWEILIKDEGVYAFSEYKRLPRILAQIYRGISRKRLQLYPSVKEVLDELKANYRLALISDAQPCYALPEIRAVSLDGYFDPVIISADYGYRKPDERLFQTALSRMSLSASEVICVGNDMYRDIYGASKLGIKTIHFTSNHGTKSYENLVADYVAEQFTDVLKGIAELLS